MKCKGKYATVNEYSGIGNGNTGNRGAIHVDWREGNKIHNYNNYPQYLGKGNRAAICNGVVLD